jgi:hypothetical protein
VLKLWFPDSLSALGFLDFILSLSEIGYSHFGPMGHSHDQVSIRWWRGFLLFWVQPSSPVVFRLHWLLAHRNCEFGGGLVAFLWICVFASLF